jgi:predicted nucleic acid-binding protein
MLHVFVETNWVVDFAAPSHRQTPTARSLLNRARRGDLKLYLPSLCLVEARKVIVTRFQPRGEANAIRHFVRWAIAAGKLSKPERDAVMKTLDMFESKVGAELGDLDSSLAALRSEPGLEVFALNDDQLKLAIDVGFVTDLNPFDQSVLAAVLGRADEIRLADPTAELAFCELDSDLQPLQEQSTPFVWLRRGWVNVEGFVAAPSHRGEILSIESQNVFAPDLLGQCYQGGIRVIERQIGVATDQIVGTA